MAVMTVTKENFQEEVMQAGCPVLLDFWATWCGPCRMVSPIVDEIGAEVTGAKVGKVNVDEQPELAQAFGIASIPTLLVIFAQSLFFVFLRFYYAFFLSFLLTAVFSWPRNTTNLS